MVDILPNTKKKLIHLYDLNGFFHFISHKFIDYIGRGRYSTDQNSYCIESLIACETGISCAGGLLTWILGLICLENGNMPFFSCSDFGHVTGWVNMYSARALHEQYLHLALQSPLVPLNHLLQHVVR